jgi:hypothetical protein
VSALGAVAAVVGWSVGCWAARAAAATSKKNAVERHGAITVLPLEQLAASSSDRSRESARELNQAQKGQDDRPRQKYQKRRKIEIGVNIDDEAINEAGH